jgi:ribonuclease BN (tRNA processing enzyme)
MRIEFCGVRGSAATPDADHLIFGGNTSCIVVTMPDQPDHFFILDAGTGLARFGSRLKLDQAYSATVLLCHLHLHHILGLQFTPLVFSKRCTTWVIGPNTTNFALESVFDHIMSPSFSPVYGLEHLMAQVTFSEVSDQPITVGPTTIRAAAFPHDDDSSSWGYRLEHGGKVLVYLTDAQVRLATGELDPRALALVKGADVLIGGAFDPTFQRQERTTYEDVLSLAERGGVPTVYLTHHHPEANDEHLTWVQGELNNHNPHLKIVLGREGLVAEV